MGHHSLPKPHHACGYKKPETTLSLLSVTSVLEMDPSLSSSRWTTGDSMLLPSFGLIGSTFSTLPSTAHSSLLGTSSCSLPDTPASPLNGLSSNGIEQLSDVFLIDQSENHEAVAELPNTDFPENVNGSYPSSLLTPESAEFNRGTTFIQLARQQHEQQQLISSVGDLWHQSYGLETAGVQSLAPGGWGLTETTGLLLQDMHCAVSPSRTPSFDGLWIEEVFQEQQPPIQSLLDIQQHGKMPCFPPSQHEHHRLLQNQRQQRQSQYDQITTLTPYPLGPRLSSWLWHAFDQNQNLPSPQYSLQGETPFSNLHFNPYTNIPINYECLQQSVPIALSPTSSSSVSSSPSQHQSQHLSLSYGAFDHTYDQYQQFPHQYFPRIRRNSASSSHYHHCKHRSSPPAIPFLKRRRRLTAEESEFLMTQFSLNGRPTAQERESFAKHLKLDRRTIQVWFQNRRAKLKRDERGGNNIGESGGVDDEIEQGEADYDEGAFDMQEQIAKGQEESGACMFERDLVQEQQESRQTTRESMGGDLLRLLPQYGPKYPFISPLHCPLDISDLEGMFPEASRAEGVFNFSGDDLGQDQWNE